MKKVIGIDLGTTNSCAAVFESGVPQVIPTKEGSRTTPSIVAFTEKGGRLVGQIAKRQALINPVNTVYAIKRLIGRKYNSAEVAKARSFVPYQIVPAPNGDARVKIKEREYSPEEISAYVLQHIREYSEDYLGTDVLEAVITTPAYFNDSQRQATKDAGRIAGLEVKRIINEPTAAALAYGLDKQEQETIAVYDLGGGTFDITILKLNAGTFEVLSTSGNTFLGGEDIDQRVINWIVESFLQDTGIDLKTDRMAMQRIKESAEKAKCELSSALETRIHLPFITADQSGPKHLELPLSRAKFEQLVSDIIDTTLTSCEQALRDAGLQPASIGKIILVGGQTRTPKVIDTVKKFFNREPSKEINPDEVVAIGASIQAAILEGEVKELVLLDVTPLSLGIETKGASFTKIIERNCTIPCKNAMVFTTVVDNQNTVEIHVIQGESEKAFENKSLGKFELAGILPAPKGVPQITVSFDIDANGIVHVSAMDKNTGRQHQIKITPSGGLTPKEVEHLALSASKEEKQEKVTKEVEAIRSQLKDLLESNKRVFEQFGSRLEESEQVTVKTVLQSAEEALSKGNSSAINTSIEQMQRASSLLAEAMLRFAP
ncbi:MAG: molecular chaperone DnaK [Candidatus Fischerbacteria bacterium RBG_13_37_8]|uniref:Mitochondrial-type heat shock protein 70 n=1 Tax=Candidatus Fischerbacteria bacterium RBG_13_37_8 TaxID=1817863 RepID=A0A1F5VUP1_9BACT|nr:MAG: molecular chaperone DnaK [Candidatus Fischerbacteria bacterium RBG_13_37_8]